MRVWSRVHDATTSVQLAPAHIRRPVKVINRRTTLDLARIVKHAGGWLPIIGVTALLGTLSTLALPSVLGRAVDAVVAGEAIHRPLLVAACLILISVAGEIVGAFAGTACTASTTAWLRTRLVRQALAVSPQRSRQFETGDLVSRTSGDAAEAAEAGPSLVTVLSGVLPPVGSVVLLAYIDVWLAVTFVGTVGIVAAVLVGFTRRTADVMTKYQEAQGLLAARLAESLGGARTIAAAATVEREEARVLAVLPQLRALGVQTWRVLAAAAAQSGIVGPMVMVAVVGVAGLQLVNGRISAGDLLAASQYAVLGAGLGGMTGVFAAFARARAGIRRLGQLLNLPPTTYGPAELRSGHGELVFENVTVFGSDGAAVLDRVDLTIPAGRTVAVVGRSGAGKSVLAELAARLRDPDVGTVSLDGVRLTELTHGSLRSSVGIAFERPVMVGTTIADAIGDDYERAARASHAHEFVSRLPDGYETLLHDAPMSGGERQRLGLARAWHANRFLVLDDATSSLDMVTEMQIGRTLTNGSLGSTTRLIVTHRASTAARADLVVWLDTGHVRGVSTHERLLADPSYRGIFE